MKQIRNSSETKLSAANIVRHAIGRSPNLNYLFLKAQGMQNFSFPKVLRDENEFRDWLNSIEMTQNRLLLFVEGDLPGGSKLQNNELAHLFFQKTSLLVARLSEHFISLQLFDDSLSTKPLMFSFSISIKSAVTSKYKILSELISSPFVRSVVWAGGHHLAPEQLIKLSRLSPRNTVITHDLYFVSKSLHQPNGSSTSSLGSSNATKTATDERLSSSRDFLLAADLIVFPSEYLLSQHSDILDPSSNKVMVIPFPLLLDFPLKSEGLCSAKDWGGRIKIAFFDERRLDHETLSLFRFLASRRFIKPRILGANFLLSRHRFLRKVRNYKPSLAVVSNPYADSFSRLLSELVAMGVPVVVGGHGALPERVRQHGCGFLIEDPEDRNVVRQILDQKLEHSSYISRRQNALEYGRYLSGDALKLLWTEIAIDCN